MKKLTMFALAGLIALSACKNEVVGPKGDTGAQGPKGDAGAQGPKGEPGTANAWSYMYRNQQYAVPGTPEYNSLTKMYSLTGYRYVTPEKYAEIAEWGAVLVYLRDEVNPWTLNTVQFRTLGVDWNDPGSTIESTVRTLADKIQITGRRVASDDRKDPLMSYKFDVKVILIAPTHTALNALRAGRVNLQNLRAVEHQLKLNPER